MGTQPCMLRQERNEQRLLEFFCVYQIPMSMH
uniref:Uncharacterized protein n=1 Tax=Arundo donax TaxID=35708 RepID=A0A0A9F4F9_ARUDO